jgi:hypothetical protein
MVLYRLRKIRPETIDVVISFYGTILNSDTKFTVIDRLKR